MATSLIKAPAVVYPESDGKPMGETGIHVEHTLALYAALRLHVRRRRRVYVGCNLFVYYQEGDPTKVVCPDVFVAFGVRGGQRRTWKVWEEGKAPDVVFEITSDSTRREDLGNKRALYAELGVREYFLFDPLSDWLDPPLRGYELVGSDYRLLGDPPLRSRVLGLELHVQGERLRLYDPAAERWFLGFEEEAEAREDAESRLKEADQEIARLRAQLKRRGKG